MKWRLVAKLKIMMRSFRTRYIVISTMVLSVAMVTLSLAFFVWSSANLNKMLGERMTSMVNLATGFFPAEQQQQVIGDFFSGKPESFQSEAYQKVTATLKLIQSENGEQAKAVAFVRDPQDQTKVIVVGTGRDRSILGSSIAMDELVQAVFSTGKIRHSPVIKDSAGAWVSSAGPIADSTGKTVAVLRVDAPVTADLEVIRRELNWVIISSVIMSSLLSIMFGHLASNRILAPIQQLSKSAAAVSKGDLSVRVKVTGNDEISQFGEAFNKMIDEMGTFRLKLVRQATELEESVRERTQELWDSRQTVQAMLDSVQDAFFMFDIAGKCLDVSSSNCETIIEGRPNLRDIKEVLRLKESEHATFDRWKKNLFAGAMAFEDLAPLGPRAYSHTKDRNIFLVYFPVYSNEKKLKAVVVVATDRTAEISQQEQARQKERRAEFVLKAAQMGQALDAFFFNAEKDLMKVRLELVDHKQSKLSVAEIVSIVHTIKGEASIFSLDEISNHAHKLEDLLRDFEKGKGDEVEISNQVNRLQETLLENRMLFYEINIRSGGPDLNAIREQRSKFVELITIMNELSIPRELRIDLLKYGISQQIGWFFTIYSQFVQDVAVRLGKKMAPLEFENPDLPIYAEPYQEMFRTVVHLIRNSLDHGIETPKERAALNKSEIGHLRIKFERYPTARQWFLRITLADDGCGIDPSTLREKIRSIKGDAVVDGMSDEQLLQQIFDPGLSTKRQISELSGRGVGLSAVKQACRALDGEVRVESELGVGTTFIIEIPDSYDRLINPRQRKLVG